ncbi:hypothetical protein N7524_008735 [Penicillium chrysogenum]|nr:hypothetical protein N7524_008735 [Penicillium chrysogenum]
MARAERERGRAKETAQIALQRLEGPQRTGWFTPAITGVAELGEPDQWQKCLIRKARMGAGRGGWLRKEEQESQKVEGAMGRTL